MENLQSAYLSKLLQLEMDPRQAAGKLFLLLSKVKAREGVKWDIASWGIEILPAETTCSHNCGNIAN